LAYSYTDPYRAFRGRQAKLAELLSAARKEIEGLNLPQQEALLEGLEKKVRSDSFKIQVTGTFKNGKSTFINAFLGEDVLPAYALPCTAVINEVRYGKEKKAVLYFRDPLPETLPRDIPKPVLAHMQKHNMKAVPPVIIPYDQIERYVVIPMGADPSQMLLESPYDKVVLYWPLPLLAQGVRIIDSPGLNEHATRTRVTMDHLSKADAILFVLSAQALCAKEEMSFLENSLAAQGFHDPIFVVNRFDCIPEREKPEIMRYAKAKLDPYTTLGERGLYFTSALNALEAKKERNGTALKASGMARLEKELSEYLVQQKGQAKLSQPAWQLRQILENEALERAIPMQKKLINSSLSEIRQRYEQAQPRLELLKQQKNQLRARLELQISGCEQQYYQAARDSMVQMAELVPQWLEGFKPTTKIGTLPTKHKAQMVVKEMLAHLSDQLERHQIQWRKNTLTQMMLETDRTVFQPAIQDVRTMLGNLSSIGSQVSGQVVAVANADQSWIETAVRGLDQNGGASVNEQGMQGASQSVAKNTATSVGTRVLLGLLSWFSPLFAAVVLGKFLFDTKKREENALNKMKEEIIKSSRQIILEQANASAQMLTQSLRDSFQKRAQELVEMVERSIQEWNEQLQAIMKEMEQGQEHINSRLAELDGCEKRIRQLIGHLNDWMEAS